MNNVKLQKYNAFQGPLFIIAVPRSGSTLLNLLLDAHPSIAIPYESKFITDFYRDGTADICYSNSTQVKNLIETILQGKYVSEWDVELSLDNINLDRCIDYSSTITAIYECYAQKRGKFIWGDKDPYYVGDVDVLYNLFPRAKFIFLVRDGRDVALSLKDQWWGPNDFVSCLRYWEKMVLLSSKILSILPEVNVFRLRYEDLVSKPEFMLRNITDFLGVPFSESMLLRYAENVSHKVGEDRAKKHHSKLAEKPRQQHAYKWKKTLSKCDQSIAHEIAGHVLSEFDYEQGCDNHTFKFFRKIYHWGVGIQRNKFKNK